MYFLIEHVDWDGLVDIRSIRELSQPQVLDDKKRFESQIVSKVNYQRIETGNLRQNQYQQVNSRGVPETGRGGRLSTEEKANAR